MVKKIETNSLYGEFYKDAPKEVWTQGSRSCKTVTNKIKDEVNAIYGVAQMPKRTNKKIFILRLDSGNGWVYYNQTSTILALSIYIKIRGCKRMTIRLKNEEEYKEFSVEEFYKMFPEGKEVSK